MSVVLSSPNTIVTEENGVITIKPRQRTIYLMAIVEILIGALAYGASRLRFTADGAMEQFCLWAAILLWFLAALMLLIALLQSARAKTILDCNTRMFRKGVRSCRFAEIERLSVESRPFADRELIHLTAHVPGQLVSLAVEAAREHLEPIARFVEQRLQIRESAEPASSAGRTVVPRFTGILLLVMGVLWTASGYLFLRSIIFTRPGGSHGPLLWPLGLWIAGLGVLELLGIPVYRWLREGTTGRKILIGALVFGSYFLVCWR